jgi:hypothetical protein
VGEWKERCVIMGVKVTVTGGAEVKTIELSEFMVGSYQIHRKHLKNADGTVLQEVFGLELSGGLAFLDRGLELPESDQLSLWANHSVYDKEVYRRVQVTLSDLNNQVYDEIEIKEAFVVSYREGFETEKGNGGLYQFHILIRRLYDEALPEDAAPVSELPPSAALESGRW